MTKYWIYLQGDDCNKYNRHTEYAHSPGDAARKAQMIYGWRGLKDAAIYADNAGKAHNILEACELCMVVLVDSDPAVGHDEEGLAICGPCMYVTANAERRAKEAQREGKSDE